MCIRDRSKTVYLKIRQLTKTDKQDVYLSDVAEVYAEKKLLPKRKSIKLATFYRTKTVSYTHLDVYKRQS